jgi:acetyl-CoA synthetase
MTVDAFRAARDFLFQHRTDYATAYAQFRWPVLEHFNWALDWFDGELAANPDSRDRAALRFVDAEGGDVSYSFAEMAARSNRVANYLRSLGVRRGDRILMMLGNVVSLWDTMLAAMKLGAVVIPATPLLNAGELEDRLERGRVRWIVADVEQTPKFKDSAVAARLGRIVADGSAPGWQELAVAFSGAHPATLEIDAPTRADDLLLLYFTSGTTAKPKLVMHSHRSYPVGALSTLYWIGLQPGDLHLNISSPGWAKHAWSCFFAPWCAGATILLFNQPRFDAKRLLAVLAEKGVTTLCAPPTVWRMIIQEDMSRWKTSLREVCSAGEPLNPEVIEHVQRLWGLTIRDGFGQTETTAQIANPPGQPLKIGSMGRPLPGYRHLLLDPDGNEAQEGEICLPLDAERPAGLMLGYEIEGAQPKLGTHAYHTGDIASRDAEGYLTFVGRADDVFKSSDYRISPFELESVLIEHPAIAEAAVVPTPDPIRLSVPKAFVILAAGVPANRETAAAIFAHSRARLAPYKRVRRLALVAELPKTVSGKIRRAELRRGEEAGMPVAAAEFREEDFN